MDVERIGTPRLNLSVLGKLYQPHSVICESDLLKLFEEFSSKDNELDKTLSIHQTGSFKTIHKHSGFRCLPESSCKIEKFFSPTFLEHDFESCEYTKVWAILPLLMLTNMTRNNRYQVLAPLLPQVLKKYDVQPTPQP